MSTQDKSLIRLLVFPILFWITLGILPSTPKHDGVRQFISFFPLLGLWAGLGWYALIEKLSIHQKVKKGLVFFPLLVFPFSLWKEHPYYLSYYNTFIGGLPGAEKKGMELTYWLEPLWPEAIAYINHEAPEQSRIIIFPAWPEILRRYQQEGLLRKDLVISDYGKDPSDIIVACHRRSLVNETKYRETSGDFDLQKEGVSLVKIVKFIKPKRASGLKRSFPLDARPAKTN